MGYKLNDLFEENYSVGRVRKSRVEKKPSKKKPSLISKEHTESGVLYTKLCPSCNKYFETHKKRQVYCTEECNKKYNDRLVGDRKYYAEIAPFERLRVKSHNFAVELMETLVKQGWIKKECSCDGCLNTDSLEVHHKDLNWLNNSPENLEFLCKSHHSKAHSIFTNSLKEECKIVEETFHPKFARIYSVITKDKI